MVESDGIVKSTTGEPGAGEAAQALRAILQTQYLRYLIIGTWALGLLAMATTLLNLWLAGRITLASGRLMRPWPDLAQFTMPGAATFALFIAIGLSFVGGMTGLLAASVAAPFTLAFALVGLAAVHVLTRGSPWRTFILTALYTGAILVPHIGLLLALGGLAETIFGYRQARKPPETPN